MNKSWAWSICLISLLFSSGWAWAQSSQTIRPEPEKPFLQPYSPAKTYQNQDACQPINDKANGHKNVSKTRNKALVANPQKTPGSHQGRRRSSAVKHPARMEVGAPESRLSFQEYNKYRAAASGSFLDGYLLKSLQEKRIGRKKAAAESTTDANQLKKKKSSFNK